MVSRGPGGCGGRPYMVDAMHGMKGNADDAISYCRRNRAESRSRWDPSRNNYTCDSDSGVQDPEPSGKHNDWSCLFKECCVMVSRGPGGCGAKPYMAGAFNGSPNVAISYCLANPACTKVQWNKLGNIYPSDQKSGVQATEPNGGSWSCRFKECSPNISSIWESNGKMTRGSDYFSECSGDSDPENPRQC